MSTTPAKLSEDYKKLLLAILGMVLIILGWNEVELNKSVGWGNGQKDNEKNPTSQHPPQTPDGTTNLITSFIIHKVKVDRDCSYQKVVEAMCRAKFTDHEVVGTIPKGSGTEVDLHFFRPEVYEYTHSGFMNNEYLERAFKRRGLKSDPLALISYNEANPKFAIETPHGTHWKNFNGKWCYAIFDLESSIGYGIDISEHDHGVRGNWWFVGVPK